MEIKRDRIITNKLLNIDQQIEKLNLLTQFAEGTLDSEILGRLGSMIIYSGLVELYAIQAARLLEQIILKSQLHERGQTTFKPHEDVWFYDNQISTRRILKEIKKFIPFEDSKTGQRYDKEVKEFIKASNEFLDYRNSLIHRMASPRTKIEDIRHCCDKIEQLYQEVTQYHRIMSENLGPYRFSEKEIEFFYGKGNENKK
jgi:hypothetical protein